MRQKTKVLATMVILSALGVSSCAGQRMDRKIDQELKSEAPVAMGGPMAVESRKLISESPELTQEQKDKLLGLHSRMAGEMISLREEESKLKMVFFKTLLDPKTKEDEIGNLRKRLIKLERKKTDKMLSALEEAKTILGRITLKDERIYNAIFMERVGHGDLL